ncbi:uncharacterized protein LOC124914735 [Impatiens glandulifera]|uniref:uncharacterized protein LOC124914735 n=1 Tax=Impatiens glandulifera TaxID=253017 RepID=UPI001FB0EEAF|nr:uncharacterized protein LOC124914735 [Impatiens glandulifera]
MDYEEGQHVQKPKYECLLLDVDDTLYAKSSGIAVECMKNIEEYMINKLGIVDNVRELCAKLYKEYGTTMAGLRAIGYNFDYDEYHSFVHGRLPYELLKPDPVLRNLLHSISIRKVIFSNADKKHVARVISRLGIEDCFDDSICFESLNPPAAKGVAKTEDQIKDDSHKPNPMLPSTPVICKPFEDAYEQAFKIANINPQKTIFFDDSIRNLQTAKSLGLHTVWVGSSQRTNGVDHALESIHNMKEALPELWEAIERDIMPCSEKVAVETYVGA